VVFGALLTGFVRRGYARIAFGLVALVACLALGSYFIAWFGVWVMGFVCATIRPGRTGHWLVPLTILLGWLAVMRWYAPQISESMAYIFVADYILALCFCWVILAMRTARLKLLERIARFNKAMADFSYSLYLIHHPVIMFLIALLGITTGMAGFATGFDPTQSVAPAFYVGLTVAIFLLSWLFAQATERHTGRLRKFLKQRLLG
jgi:peptidoglycan/LPS O-acetylase OafA/YrhL